MPGWCPERQKIKKKMHQIIEHHEDEHFFCDAFIEFHTSKVADNKQISERQREREVSYWNDWTYIDPCCVKWASGTDR